MKKIRLKVIDTVGIHVEPAYVISGIANKYESNMHIKYKDYMADMKSTLSVISLLIPRNEIIETIVNGKDEEAAINDVIDSLKKLEIATTI